MKIKNIKAIDTKDKIDLEWAEILSRKNKLLQSSDWTQLSDVMLDEFSKMQWKEWRQKLRRISRKNNSVPDNAKQLLDLLENERPQNTKIDETLFHHSLGKDKIVEKVVEKIDNIKHDVDVNVINDQKDDKKIVEKIVEKIFIKESPLIIREELNIDKLKEQFFLIFSNDHTDLYNFLTDVINKVPQVTIYDNDDLITSKEKMLNYLQHQQKYFFQKKISQLPPIPVIEERYQQGLEFLTADYPIIENFPLIEIHSQICQTSYTEIAQKFIDDKKCLNKIIIESEKFLLYNMRRINLCDNKDSLNDFILDIKNGY